MTEPRTLVAFLNSEIRALRARIGGEGNAVQLDKLLKLRDLREYVIAHERSLEDRRASA